jgi:hypothetical protein
MPSINFAQVKGLEPVPVGNYTATIIKAETGVSKKGNEKIDLQWRVEGGAFDGRIIFDTLTFTEKALFRVKATLKGLGFPDNFKGEVRSDMLVGKSAKLTVDIQMGEGTDEQTGEVYPPRNRIKKVAQLKGK